MMMKNVILLILLALPVAINAQQVFHDKNAEVRQVEDFHTIEVSHAVDLRLSQGNENALAVSANTPELRSYIRTEVKNGVLRISYDNKKLIKRSGGARVYISAKSLKKISGSGASDINILAELSSSELTIQLSGASDMKGSIKAGAMNVELSGASDMIIKGEVKDIRISASGASKFKGAQLVSDNCRINASGASDIDIIANKIIAASASGACHIYYSGDAQMGEISTSGASKIVKR
jgi:hypothetical protein